MNRFSMATTFSQIRTITGDLSIKPHFDFEAVFSQIGVRANVAIDNGGQWKQFRVLVDLSELLSFFKSYRNVSPVEELILAPPSVSQSFTPSANIEDCFLPPIALIGILFPLAAVLVTVKVIYENKSDSFLNMYYGIEKPEGTITPHKRKFHKEFLLPPILLKPDFIQVLHIKESTFDRVNIYSDFVFYRGKMDYYLNISSRTAFSAIYFVVALRISVFCTTRFIFPLIQNKISCSILGYLFAGALTNQAIGISIFSLSSGIRGVLNLGSFLRKKVILFFLK